MKARSPPSPAPAVRAFARSTSSPHRRRGLVRSDWRLAFSGSPASRTRIGTAPGACERCRLDPLVVGLTRSWSAHAAGFVRRGLISPRSTWNICAATGPWPEWFPVAALALAPSGSRAPSLGVDTCGKAGPRPAVIPWRLHPRDRQMGERLPVIPAPQPSRSPPMHGLVIPCRPHVTGTSCPRITGGQSCGGPQQPPAPPAAARSRCCSDRRRRRARLVSTHLRFGCSTWNARHRASPPMWRHSPWSVPSEAPERR